MRLTFNKTLHGLPLVGAASFRSVGLKKLTSEHQQAKNNFIHQNQIMDNTTFLKTALF